MPDSTLVVAQSINSVIDHLAAKLAIPTSHLWAALLRQAQFDAYLAIVGFVGTVALWGWFLPRYQQWEDNDNIAAILVMGAACVTSTIVCVVSLYNLGAFWNPEYYALREILSVLHQ